MDTAIPGHHPCLRVSQTAGRKSQQELSPRTSPRKRALQTAHTHGHTANSPASHGLLPTKTGDSWDQEKPGDQHARGAAPDSIGMTLPRGPRGPREAGGS